MRQGALVTDSGLLAFFQVQVPGVTEHRITDIFKPLATPAAAERDIALVHHRDNHADLHRCRGNYRLHDRAFPAQTG